VVIPVALLFAIAALLLDSQHRARQIVDQRFDSRVETGADFIHQFLVERQNDERRVALSRFADRSIDAERFDLAVESLGFEAAVLLDDHGRLLAIYPAKPSLLGQEIASRYKHLSSAVAGIPAFSSVVPSAARGFPVVALAAPYDTQFGRRVFSGAFSVEVGALGDFLRDMLPYPRSSVFLADSSGAVAASSGTPRKGIESLRDISGDLHAATVRRGVVTAQRGHVASSGSRFLSVRVEGTELFLIAEVPASVLYEPLSRRDWPQWIVFAGLVMAAAFAIILLRRLERSRGLVQDKLAEQQRLNNALDAFSARVAHDLRSPLGTIQMTLDALASPDFDEDFKRELTSTLRHSASTATALVGDLLDLARASGTARREPVALRDLLREVDEEVPEIDIKIGDVPPTLLADPVSLRQAVLNLARNAARYGTQNGRAILEVDAQVESGATVLSFADHGPGLDASRQGDIFQPFERGGRTDVSGTGLGLAIVHAMAEAHGGRAWYEDRPGGGAVFKVSIADGG
jgi:signal transduction histidine kinase